MEQTKKSNELLPPIIQVGDLLVSSEILKEYFSCDYEKCKGICCIIGDSGAPLEENEIDEIRANYSQFSSYMSEKGNKTIRSKDFFEIDIDGDIVTPVIAGEVNREACAYTHFDERQSCFCAMEKCFLAGKSKFRKPKSCRLYPIRVSKLSNGLLALNLHRWHLCKEAFAKGRKEGVRVYEFLKAPLIEYFGCEFYAALCEIVKNYSK